MVKKKPHHYMRTRILDEGLMEYIDVVKMTDRNRDIVKMYVGGTSYVPIAEKYGISIQRVSRIVMGYIHGAHRVKGS